MTIPGSVTKVGDYAFYDCNRLTDLTIEPGVAEIGNHAFRRCTALKNITLSDGLILLLLQRCAKPEEPDNGMETAVRASLGQLEGKSEAEIQAELDRVIGEGMFHIAINPDPVFPDGASEGTLEIENVPNNHYTMRVEIYLDGTDELVYNSGLIDPNYHVQKDVLSAELAAGDYPATAIFYAYNTDDLTEMGNVSSRITLHILN